MAYAASTSRKHFWAHLMTEAPEPMWPELRESVRIEHNPKGFRVLDSEDNVEIFRVSTDFKGENHAIDD